jgi:F-type H+-transporting ATPase subunit a
MASKELNSTDYIEHHLTNLTYGKCPDGSWSFAEVHGKSQVGGTEASCQISEMGFWAFQVDTLFMSFLLGTLHDRPLSKNSKKRHLRSNHQDHKIFLNI